MRESYRKPIASKEKFPQFITMNVIDGQAGLVRYSSLIFYSLTINNILNIIVLVILAAVSIRAVYNMGIVDYAVNGTQNYARAAVAENRMFDSVVMFTERAKITGAAEVEVKSALNERPELKDNQASLAALTVARLREKGYNISDVTTVTEAITEVNLSSNNVTLNVGDPYASIDVEYQNSNTSNTKYYIQISGSYYELTITTSGTTIGQEIVDVGSIETNLTAENELSASSANTNVSTVEVVGNETVRINGIAKGTTTVTISNAGITKTVNVTVTNNIKSVAISGNAEVNVGESINLTATITPTGAEGNLTWTSQNGKVSITTSGTQNTTASITGSTSGNDVIIVKNAQNVQVGSKQIIVNTPPAAQEISFTIGNTAYTAEEGMTWGEWIESDYNEKDTPFELTSFKIEDKTYYCIDHYDMDFAPIVSGTESTSSTETLNKEIVGDSRYYCYSFGGDYLKSDVTNTGGSKSYPDFLGSSELMQYLMDNKLYEDSGDVLLDYMYYIDDKNFGEGIKYSIVGNFKNFSSTAVFIGDKGFIGYAATEDGVYDDKTKLTTFSFKTNKIVDYSPKAVIFMLRILI